MKSALLILSFAAASFAADPKPAQPEQAREVKRLGSVTWDLETHKLMWTIQKGSMVNGEFVSTSEQRYAISPDQARMMVADEERAFDGQEALSLHKLLDVLSLYCAESVVWWNDGQGAPVSRQPTNRMDAPKTDDKKPVKVGQPEAPKKPVYKTPAGHIIARAWF